MRAFVLLSALALLCACDHDHEHGDDDHHHGEGAGHGHDGEMSDLSVACGHFEFGPAVDVDPAAADGGDAATISAPHRRYALSGAGVFRYAPERAGRYLLLLDRDVDLTLTRDDAVVSGQPADVAECADAAVGWFFELERATYVATVGDAATLVLHGPTGEAHAGHDHDDVPPPYAGATNPLAGDAEAIAAGEALWAAHCARCHGEGGGGDGPDAAALDPAPTDFTARGALASMTDPYLLWRVSEGGEATDMPAWKDTLERSQIWQVVSFLRTLAP